MPSCPHCEKGEYLKCGHPTSTEYKRGILAERNRIVGEVEKLRDTTGIEYAEGPMDDESYAKKIKAIIINSALQDIKRIINNEE